MDDEDKEFASKLLWLCEKYDRTALLLFVGKDEKFKTIGTSDFPCEPEDFERCVVDLFKEIIKNIESKETRATNLFFKQGKMN